MYYSLFIIFIIIIITNSLDLKSVLGNMPRSNSITVLLFNPNPNTILQLPMLDIYNSMWSVHDWKVEWSAACAHISMNDWSGPENISSFEFETTKTLKSWNLKGWE